MWPPALPDARSWSLVGVGHSPAACGSRLVTVRVLFYDDGHSFLHDAGPLLASDPLRYSVIATNTERPRTSGQPFWFAAVMRDDHSLAGVAMRTHPDPPHAGFVARMPEAAVGALAAALWQRHEVVSAWNGDLVAARALCEAMAGGSSVHVVMHTRLFEAKEIIWPQRPLGNLRIATAADEDLVTDWLRGFHHDSETQGGREPDPSWTPDVEGVRRTIGRQGVWLWEVDGVPVHMSGVQPSMFGAARIGPVYTPSKHRGRGYAGWVVAQLTRHILDGGDRPCLYTDQANPVSNKVYERIGYQRIHDEGNVIIAE